MTKRELIEVLEALDCSDQALVMIETCTYCEGGYTYDNVCSVVAEDVDTIKITNEEIT